jgi:flagellin FlaB
MVKPHRTRITRRMKAIVGIESAIVLIAFVVVAAALAFVVLNMGFFTTQRSKETIGSGLAQASSSIEIDGTVLANVTISGNNGNVTCLLIPIRLSAGQKPVDLTPGKSIISVWILGKAAFPQVYNSTDTYSFTSISNNNITTICNNVTLGVDSPVNTSIVWTTPNNHDNVLDPGEKALIVVRFDNTIAPTAYDVVKVELKVPIGAALTVERSIPASLTQQVIDLG